MHGAGSEGIHTLQDWKQLWGGGAMLGLDVWIVFSQNVFMYYLHNEHWKIDTYVKSKIIPHVQIRQVNRLFCFLQGFLPNLTTLRWPTRRLSFTTCYPYWWFVTISVTLGTWGRSWDLLLAQAAAKYYSPKVRALVPGWIGRPFVSALALWADIRGFESRVCLW